MRDLVGVILAGGEGARMGYLSRHLPKPLLPVCNQTLIGHQLDAMRDVGIRDVHVVVGHLGHLIRESLGSGDDRGLRISYVEQKERLGIAHALGMLESHVRSPLVLFLADIYFRPAGLEQLVLESRQSTRGSSLVVRRDTFESFRKNFAVLHEPGTRRVIRVVEKPTFDPGPDRLKGCGLYIFDVPIFDAIRRTPRSALRNEFEITDAIQVLIDSGEPVDLAEVVEEDVNVSTPEDLLRCNLHELDRRGVANLVGARAEVSAGARLRRCVIGPGARITGTVELENCLVFPGVKVLHDRGVIRDRIFTVEGEIDCAPGR